MYDRPLDIARDRLRTSAIFIAIACVVGPIVAAVTGYEDWVLTLVLVPIGAALLLWLRPGQPRRGHVAWVARVEAPADEVAQGRSFDPFYVPTCGCGWEDPYYDDALQARAAAEKHAVTVEPDFRRTFEPIED
jgi:hypothetical protein